jgi:hypothetical protein
METTAGILGGSLRKRLATVLVAFALVAGSLLLVQQQASAAPAPAVTAQIGGDFGNFFQSIVCPILLSIRNAFSGGFFGDFVTPIINQFLVAFGCAPSG